MTSISPQALHAKIVNRHSLRIIDVRTPVEFAAAHIPESASRPLEALEASELARECSRFQGEVFVICQSGIRACKAISKLEQVGCYDCVLVEGGMAAWIASNYPVDRQPIRVISLERQVRIAAGLLVLAGTLLGIFVHPMLLVIPVLIGSGLVFAGLSDKCGMALLLARMPWNRFPNKANEPGCGFAR